MCGHFALDPVDYDSHDPLGMDGGTLALRTAPHLRPTDPISLLRAEGPRLHSQIVRWGRDVPQAARPVINARLETLSQRPLFRPQLGRFHCLIPATAWFEWRHEGSDKVGYRFAPQQGRLWHFAGLYWPPSERLPQGGAVIVTRAAEGAVSDYHHRMPHCLDPASARAWLAGEWVTTASSWRGRITPIDPHRPVQPRLF
ncbi:protein of unknown function DUF159 [Ferrimonas balearica DSM 9799]|uniref:Abasic site processing protein n=1 Tax=Ferrimonas balearica (strain DSM 9799 / CCM 4581 / KCTC 23876 / PAT) TaxID=550540 RepID=E1STA7_FERBD|nr:SOS response-associated peptidase family protein [Ferrimonas balearica]ADN77141.1 protein of unknown function DUF159 [Ferrimonas balearica DSM 9799]